MKLLFSPLQIQSIEFKNRIWVSPMCQYSSRDGHPTDWHFVHLGSRAIGGAGLIVVEATAVSPEGRISPADSGIWSDAHVPSFKRVTDFLRAQGAVPGIQIAHAGRKASTYVPWEGRGVLPISKGGWETVGPSGLAFDETYGVPKEMGDTDIQKAVADFQQAASRAFRAGFQVLEIHMAHGYLLHEFLSPISNQRKDHYGGNLENRMRFPLDVVRAVREKWPEDLPLFVRVSATDWAEKGTPSWTLEDSIVLARELKALGVDLIDCSSGGNLPHAKIPQDPGYQVPFSEAIRREADILTAAVGLIREPDQAERVLSEEKADAVFMGREFLRDPYFPQRAARGWGIKTSKSVQYERA